MFTLGQTFPADSRHLGGQIHVSHHNIRTFEVNRDEAKAFLYRRNENTLVACGILAVDAEEGIVKLALGGDEVRNVEQGLVYYTKKGNKFLRLAETEVALFREFYPLL